jgi:hypothetical protein
MSPKAATAKRKPPTPEEIRDAQRKQAEEEHARIQENLPATRPATTVAVPDNRTDVQRYIDDVAPASIVGRMIKFNKDGAFVTHDDGEPIGEEVDFVALVDQTLIGWIKFNGEGAPPDRVMGLLYDGFVMPARDTLGDDDPARWEMGLDGRPADPWQHHVYLVLQKGDTGELFTFVTSSITGRRAVGNLLRHYDRMLKTPATADFYPVVRLKIGGFQHRDDRVGWVKTPVIAVVGRAPKDSAATPDSSPAADMNDQIPF